MQSMFIVISLQLVLQTAVGPFHQHLVSYVEMLKASSAAICVP